MIFEQFSHVGRFCAYIMPIYHSEYIREINGKERSFIQTHWNEFVSNFLSKYQICIQKTNKNVIVVFSNIYTIFYF